MDPVFIFIISLSLSLLFGFAAFHKAKSFAAFRTTMNDYRLIPSALSTGSAVAIITIEAVAAIAVLIPATRTYGLQLIIAVLAIYTAGIGINLLRGRRNIDCGCSGPASRHELSGWLVSRNLILLSLAVIAMKGSMEGMVPRDLNWLDSLVVLLAVCVASILYMGANQLLAQAPRLNSLRTGA